jgi:hypothetical protein
MTPEQAKRRWQQAKVARQRRDVELETFPATGGTAAKTSHPMFGTSGAGTAASARLRWLVRELPAPAGLEKWGTTNPAAIEHVGGGYYLISIVLMSEDDGWWDDDWGTGAHIRHALAVWLLRPDQTISEAWVSPGYTQFTYEFDNVTFRDTDAPPYGEPIYISTPKLTRWQEGALLSFTIFTGERQYVSDLSDFWPQYDTTELDVPYAANVYRWIGHDRTDPVVGPALELYAGGDDDFPGTGDWETGGGTEFDDGTVEGFEVIGPSADPNIAVYGLATNSNRHRVWLLEKDPADNTLSLAQRTTIGGGSFGDSPRLSNPGGLTRIGIDRWISMASTGLGSEKRMLAALFDAKTGSVLDVVQWEVRMVDCYFISSTWVYYAANFLHFDGQAVFAAWLGEFDDDNWDNRYATLTVADDKITVGTIGSFPVPKWSFGDPFRFDEFSGQSARFVETCEGCLRAVGSTIDRAQLLYERRTLKGKAPLFSPEYIDFTGDPDGEFLDQRVVPSSHPAGSMWAVNVTFFNRFLNSSRPQNPPLLIRYPA